MLMPNKSGKPKPNKLTKEQQQKLDEELTKFAELIYDIYQDKKRTMAR
jgi:hypothetical protein